MQRGSVSRCVLSLFLVDISASRRAASLMTQPVCTCECFETLFHLWRLYKSPVFRSSSGCFLFECRLWVWLSWLVFHGFPPFP